MAQLQFINASHVKKFIKATRPDARVSMDFLVALDGMVRNKIEWSITLPMNRKTVKDIL